jgi:hypothetical protein
MNSLAELITRLQSNVWYASLMVVLAVSGLALLSLEFTRFATPEYLVLSARLDLAIAFIFLTDFLLGWVFNRGYSSRGDYWRKNWLDFISSIPITSDMARALRILRVFRALRVISSALDIWFTRKRLLAIKNNKRK